VHAAEAVQEEAVGGAEPESAPACERFRFRHVVQEPPQLARRKVGVQGQACLGQRQSLRALGAQAFDDRCGAGVLPDDGVVQRLAGVRIPGDHGFALIGDADAVGPGPPVEALAQMGQQFQRVVLHPAGLGIELAMLERAQGDERAFRIQQIRARAAKVLVDADHE
jgi:hypothetical protein